jgi:tRNA G18 (ribose-2'-O)-methylase SpoU
MAHVPPFDADPDEVRALLEPLRNRVSIAVYNCQNAFAVGAIVRVAHSFLVREIVVIGEEPYYRKASMGMHRYERITRVPDVDAFVRHASGRPIWAIEKDHATVSLHGVAHYPDDVIFVFGSERAGLPAELVAQSHAVIGVPMYGVNHSFPVTVAAGIVLYDWARRRYAPGATIAGPHARR